MLTASTLLAPPDKNGKKRSLRDAKTKIEEDLFGVWLAGTLYWPAVNMVVFKLVAVQHRAVVNSCFGTAWNVYLSSKANAGLEEEEGEEGEAIGETSCDDGKEPGVLPGVGREKLS